MIPEYPKIVYFLMVCSLTHYHRTSAKSSQVVVPKAVWELKDGYKGKFYHFLYVSFTFLY